MGYSVTKDYATTTCVIILVQTHVRGVQVKIRNRRTAQGGCLILRKGALYTNFGTTAAKVIHVSLIAQAL